MVDWSLDGILPRGRPSERPTRTEKSECDWRFRPTVPAFSSPCGLLGVSKRGPCPPGLRHPPRHTGQSKDSAGQASHAPARDTFLGPMPAPACPHRKVQWELRNPPWACGGQGTVARGTQLSWHRQTNVSPVDTRPSRQRRRKPWPREKRRDATRSGSADESPGPLERVWARPSRHGCRRKP